MYIENSCYYNQNVAIVEDNEDILELIGRGFRKHGFCVEAFTNAHDFITCFFSNKYGAVIIDINLEKEGYGIELVKMINILDEKIAIILYSGDYSYLYNTRLKEVNISYFLLKPFSIDDIVEKTKEAIELNYIYFTNLNELKKIKDEYLSMLQA
jgi:DNA-binding NtrC family response regulator